MHDNALKHSLKFANLLVALRSVRSFRRLGQEFIADFAGMVAMCYVYPVSRVCHYMSAGFSAILI